MFVLLALVFALGFVFFGVGSGSSIGDLLQGNLNFGHSSGSSISSLQAKVKKSPEDAASWLKLSQAYQAKGQTDQAIAPMRRYMALRPKDTGALSTLVSLQRTHALTLAQQAYDAQVSAGSLASDPTGGLTSPKTGPVISDPIEQAVQTKVSTRQTTLTTQATAAFKQTEASLKKLVAASPDDTSTLFDYAQISQYAGDTTTALAGYRKFLKLAPDDPKATVAKQQIKALAPPPVKKAKAKAKAQSGSG
jgi:cytochrome c-type biogenesis protein CcmH/NrfG